MRGRNGKVKLEGSIVCVACLQLILFRRMAVCLLEVQEVYVFSMDAGNFRDKASKDALELGLVGLEGSFVGLTVILVRPRRSCHAELTPPPSLSPEEAHPSVACQHSPPNHVLSNNLSYGLVQ